MTVDELQRLGNDIRRHVLRAVHHAGAGHIGGVFSAADMLAALYFSELRIDPQRPHLESRDRFILSKGHCGIGLYAVLAMRGYFPVDELFTFDAIDSRLQGHPDMTKLPGLDMSTGSLGQGLSPGVGMALGARFLHSDFQTWVMIGDGETQEGQIWEAAFTAARYQLANLTAILDWNHLQQFGWPTSQGYAGVARRDPTESPAQKWRAFGWNVIECDGHDVADFRRACDRARRTLDRPTLILARTIKGKGISFMENDYTWHSRPISDEDLAAALGELDRADEPQRTRVERS
ncbi:MAG: transketolase [Candidatus Eremiobacter antarcticus]|nr:transketolase [Candidatus Eremiobacteraeota bacterium]PZR60273.1 MAG: transketolase [Candidatus Eremiobacter sp. RRmetagenome_bin22]